MDIEKIIDSFAWCQETWAEPAVSDEARLLLQACADIHPTEPVCDLQEIINSSEKFPLPFPIDSVRLKTLKNKVPVETLKRNVVSTYPLIHSRVLVLMADFLIYKRKYGSGIEKQLYENMSIPQFIDRLLQKRAATFIKAKDQYLLVSGEKGSDGWESVGTDNETPPLTVARCLSYDEVKVSALVAESGWTACVNDGTRKNVGVPKEDGVEKEAIIIGLVGARFKRVNRMEYEDMVLTKEPNPRRREEDAEKAWRELWCRFYQIPNLTFAEATARESPGAVASNSRLVRLPGGGLFHNLAFARRSALLVELALLEAEHRAVEEGKMAFLNVIGVGLGVWRMSHHQNDVFVSAALDVTRRLLAANAIAHVADVNFAYISTKKQVSALFKPDSDSKGNKDAPRKLFLKNSSHPRGGVNVQSQNREPSSALSGQHEHEGKLLALTYAWDGDALPGNEFWLGKLSSSGDSAAACATQVAELHNPHINPRLCGGNTRIANYSGVTAVHQHCREHYVS